jgi:hypothetical protein
LKEIGRKLLKEKKAYENNIEGGRKKLTELGLDSGFQNKMSIFFAQ